MQETFLAAIRSFESCRNPEKPITWLFSILNNKIVDFYKKSAKSWKVQSPNEEKQVSVVDSLFDQKGYWTPEAKGRFITDDQHLLDTPEFNQLLEKCLNELPEKWKIAVILKFIHQKKGKEICQELGITPSNYWQVLHRAKSLLKICLEKYWKG